MLDLFLTSVEKQAISRWEYRVTDNSLSTKLLSPFWNHAVQWVPESVAPNVLSLSGLICLLHAYYMCVLHIDEYPRTVSLIAMLLVFAYQTLDAIDGKHARRIRNASPLGELFDHACDNVGVIFLVLILCSVLGVTNVSTLWYIVQIAQLVFLCSHVEALKSGVVHFGLLTGPGEALLAAMALLAARAVHDLSWLWDGYVHVLQLLAPVFARSGITVDVAEGGDYLHEGVRLIFILTMVYTLVSVVGLPTDRSVTRNAILISLGYSSTFHAVSMFLGAPTSLSSQGVTILDVICQGLLLSIITTDVIVCKMSGRNLHPWVVLFTMVSVFSNFAILSSCFFYYCGLFYEISRYMSIPMFSVLINVYIDGIYDLCHFGHQNVFRNALQFGTHLKVGVVSDEDATPYKRKPIMTTEERALEVSGCGAVHEVIRNAPCNGLTRDFILKHNIHIVAHSAEYDHDDDIYYRVPRDMGITRVLPRTEGISTSDLIRRIVQRDELLEKYRT